MGKVHLIDDREAAGDYGFYMPAEWEPHECCWMAWPHRPEYWLDQHEATKRAYVKVAHAISEFEPVKMLVSPGAYQEAKSLLGDKIRLVPMAIDQAWIRDTGPNFLVDDEGGIAGSSWQFNSWGGNYRHYANDALIGDRLLNSMGLSHFTSDIYAEGGGISIDGCGTVLTTESCFLNPNRNPNYSKEDIEQELCRTLGARKVIWLPGDPTETETDGHVDGIAAFVRPGVVLLEMPANRDDAERWATHEANLAALTGQTDAEGRELQIEFIVEAYDAVGEGDMYCRSYINSYLANGGVVMPSYGIESDEKAKAVYQKLYPERRIIQVPAHAIFIAGGGIHCITQQQPAAKT